MKREHINDYQGLIGIFDFDQDKMYSRSQIRRYYKPIGLPNIGNTCYMNSLLQILAGSQRFMDYVKKLWSSIKLDPNDTNSLITLSFIDLLINLNHGSS